MAGSKAKGPMTSLSLRSMADSIAKRVQQPGPRRMSACTQSSIREFIASGQSAETGISEQLQVDFGFGLSSMAPSTVMGPEPWIQSHGSKAMDRGMHSSFSLLSAL